MFRTMRRSKQQLTREECIAILQRGSSGVLAVAGDDGYPYAVPLSYVYENGSLWFHGAAAGHKTDAIRQNGKVSFCVVDRDEVIPEKLTTAYRSVIVFGKASILEDEQEIRAAARAIGRKYSPNMDDKIEQEIKIEFPHMAIVRLDMEHMTGKEGLELYQARNNK